ncbi:antitoxin VbhA family protein [Microbacterium sp. NPDC090225]|uniref:antitoxin VbhA family protein n=1 Tax=Microbacterium sp. NPDC090225 TaxID=3364207 RepID=UPI0037F48777
MRDDRLDHSRQQRLSGVLEAFHSCWLDGLKPTSAAIRDGWDYIEGRRTLDELIEDVVRRHTRTGHDRRD